MTPLKLAGAKLTAISVLHLKREGPNSGFPRVHNASGKSLRPHDKLTPFHNN